LVDAVVEELTIDHTDAIEANVVQNVDVEGLF